MAPYFKLLQSQSPAVLPTSVAPDLAKLEAANQKELEILETRLAEAEKTEGETEISDALRAKASYLTKIGDKVYVPKHVRVVRSANDL